MGRLGFLFILLKKNASLIIFKNLIQRHIIFIQIQSGDNSFFLQKNSIEEVKKYVLFYGKDNNFDANNAGYINAGHKIIILWTELKKTDIP